MPFLSKRKLKKKKIAKRTPSSLLADTAAELGQNKFKTSRFWYKALNPESDRVNTDGRTWSPGTLLMQKGLLFLQTDRNS